MGQTYTRQSSFADGDTITAALFNNEYNQLVNAFSYSATNEATTGHRHDGSAGEGGNIPQIGDLDFLNKIVVDSTNNRWGFFVQVSTNTIEQIRLQDGALLPVTDSDVDLGTSSLYFKDAYIDSITTTGNVAVGGNLTVTGTTTFNGGTITMGDAATDNVVFGADVDSNIIPDDDDTYDLGSSTQEWRNLYIDGTANIDSLVADTADINGGTIDGAVIGGSSAAAITGTTITGTAITGTSFVIGSATITEAELEILDGATVTTDELNILDGVTSTAAELNLLDGVTSTTAELNILDGVTASAADINLIDGITNGTVIASKAIITDANKDITGGRNITITGELDAGSLDVSGNVDVDGTLETDALSINGTAVTSTAAELNILDGVTATATELNLIDGVTATTAELNILDGVTSTAAELNILDGKAFLDEDDMASNSATGIASQQSIKAYVDTQITAEDLDITTDSGTIAIDLDSETLTVSGGTGLDSSATGNAVTLAIDNTVATLTGSQTLTNKSLTAPTLTGTAVVASLDISGDIDVDGTTNLDVVDIDGAVDMASTLNVTGVITGTLATASQPNITSLGTLTGLTSTGNLVVGTEDNNAAIIEISGGATGNAEGGEIRLDTAVDYDSTYEFYRLDVNQDDFRIGRQGQTDFTLFSDGTAQFFGNLAATLSTAAQPNITSVGTLTGLTTTGDINFGDNDKAVFGASSDLQIYHDGSASYINDSGTGNLKIQGTQLQLQNAAGTLSYLAGIDGGATTIHHAGFAKLATTSTGVDVTGTVTATDLLIDTDVIVTDSTNDRVGINKTSPATTLDVGGSIHFSSVLRATGDGSESAPSIQPGNDGDTGFFRPTANTIGFSTGGSERMRIDSSGRLLVGTTSHFGTASAKLQAQGDGIAAAVFNRTNDGNVVTFKRAGGAGDVGSIAIVDSGNKIGFYGSAGSGAVIDSSGNVGIGTITFTNSYKTYIEGLDQDTANLTDSGNHGATLYLRATANAAGSGGAVAFGTTFGNKTPFAAIKGHVQDGSTNTIGDLCFSTRASVSSTALTERMRLTASGNVGIGVTNPDEKLDVEGNLRVESTSSNGTYIALRNGATNGRAYRIGSNFVSGAGELAIYDDTAGAERMRIASDGTLQTRSSDGLAPTIGSGCVSIQGRSGSSTAGILRIYKTGDDGQIVDFFRTGNTAVGNISVTASSTAYNTSSDYRLKENVDYEFNALDRVAQLKPARFNFIANADNTVDGFLAHEVQEIVPEAVTGEKDAIKEEEYEVTPAVLDDDGNVVTEAEMGTREVPDYQGIDQSKLVPLLTKAIQEQQTQIEALQSEINLLKGE